MNRKTKQRETILRLLRRTRSHLTADQLYDEVRLEIPNISKGTIYRNLKVLREMGLVSDLNLNVSLSRFEAKRESHYHFRCEKCGQLFDLDEPVDYKIEARIAEKTGFKVKEHYLEIIGLCSRCEES